MRIGLYKLFCDYNLKEKKRKILYRISHLTIAAIKTTTTNNIKISLIFDV